MDDKERAQERFVAHDVISHGITQCMECQRFADFECNKLAPKEAAKYMDNTEKCPYKQPKK